MFAQGGECGAYRAAQDGNEDDADHGDTVAIQCQRKGGHAPREGLFGENHAHGQHQGGEQTQGDALCAGTPLARRIMCVSPLGGDNEDNSGSGNGNTEYALQADTFAEEHRADKRGEGRGKRKTDLCGAQADAQGSGIEAGIAYQNSGKTGSGGRPEKMGGD